MGRFEGIRGKPTAGETVWPLLSTCESVWVSVGVRACHRVSVWV